MERSFERSYAALSELFVFLDTFLEAEEVGESDAFAVRLGLEELFTNMVKYSTSKHDDVAVRLEVLDGELILALEDADAEPFDPTAHPAPDLHASLAERKPGGLGLHLVRSVMDSIEHEYTHRSNVVTLRKKLAQ